MGIILTQLLLVFFCQHDNILTCLNAENSYVNNTCLNLTIYISQGLAYKCK